MRLTLHLLALIFMVVSADNMSDYKNGITSLLQNRIRIMPQQNQEMALKIVLKSIVDMDLCDKTYDPTKDDAVGEYFGCISSKFAECNKELNHFM